MTSDILSRYFPGITNEQEQNLLELFRSLEKIVGVFYAIIVEEKGSYKFGYISESAQMLTGHPLSKFSYHDGFSFFYSITPPQYRMLILEQEAYHWKRARHQRFDTLKPFVVEIEGAIEHIDQTISPLLLIGVILEFTNHSLPKFAINAWLLRDVMPENQMLVSKMETEKVLRNIQQVYTEMPNHFYGRADGDYPIRLTYPLYGCADITKQEYRVLKVLADGYSTKEIGDKLSISINTVETHRRHLLQKFKAINIAEMIKKATKLFWLE